MKRQDIVTQTITWLLLASAFAGALACNGKTDDTLTPFKKSGHSSDKNSQKLDSKAIQAALNDGVLVTIDSDTGTKSILKSANDSVAVFESQLKINAKKSIGPTLTFKIKKGESLPATAIDESWGLSDLKLSLSIAAQRIAKSDKKGDLGYLVLTYELGFTADDQDKNKKSLLLVMIDLNRIKSANVIFKKEVIYPIPDNFSLKEWIDKQIKQP